MALGILDPNWLVFNHAPFEHLGVSVLTFENGPWFPIHYGWSNLLTLLTYVIFLQTVLSNPEKRRDIFILSVGAVLGGIIDTYGVATNSSLRWLMLSAGTFSIAEIAILYVSRKNDLFGLLTSEKRERRQLLEHIEFQKKLLSLVTHDLSGNIRHQARIAQLLQRKLQDNHNEILEMLANSSKASDDLIDNILRWIRTQDGQFQPQLKDVEIHNLLSNCLATLQGPMTVKNIEIQIEAPSNPFLVRCDGDMMASVFRNLLSNAIRASHNNKSIYLRISLIESTVQFIIEDRGRGMPSHQVTTIWDSKNRKTDGVGYGIGLLLVRHFIELHHGTVEIHSRPDEGTKVQFTMPR